MCKSIQTIYSICDHVEEHLERCGDLTNWTTLLPKRCRSSFTTATQQGAEQCYWCTRECLRYEREVAMWKREQAERQKQQDGEDEKWRKQEAEMQRAQKDWERLKEEMEREDAEVRQLLFPPC
ncbi:hypothetical protein BAUCODRAFT_439981 [Baudoinia panamericana UAMH 10762]|uniref:Uncharacterized protein n=1 Tax=Baudoinia panamericana (strain UAMH 10762) TaxID=717646 RepID=M2MKB6_BAUPA|nr:uncharacterized protein BAUCODRAFT_439981 [Baudoinia panamericana UAMH 10762]EMC97136.1 hypothetical protein BAUCODRAFT_439981 [Baudoinia panamericana UAMH 10762]